MQLDVPTLMVAGAFVASFGAALLLFAWYQYRETRAALWWSAADALLACAVILLVVGFEESSGLPFQSGMTLFLLSAALSWAGMRSFDGHRIPVIVLLGGPAVWLLAHAVQRDFAQTSLSHVLHSMITLLYFGAAAISIKHGRGEPLRARLPLAVLLGVHAATLLLAIPSTLTGELKANEPVPVFSWFGAIHFETLVFVIGTAIFLVAMMKERSELRYHDAALTDPLSGLPNRRGFFDLAERILARARRDAAPAAVVMFDLDHFKTINDRLGHAAGDRIIQTFAEVCRTTLRPGDVVGRIGGEEFAAVMCGFGVEAGHAMGERVRRAFADAATMIDGKPVGATLCGGVCATTGSQDIHEVLRQADSALYRAKTGGRNRIERADTPKGTDGAGNVVRVA